jgi:NAD(P)H-quinone oxidoreductase subunit 4L
MVCGFLGCLANSKATDWAMTNFCDLWIFAATIIGGLIAISFGARTPFVIACGAVGSFVTLTATQDVLVRYLSLSALLFAIGMFGMIKSRNAVRVLMSIELMLNAVNINLIAFARYIDPAQVKGQLFAIFILTVAAAEAAVGLAIVLAVYRNMSTVDMNKFDLLKW